MKRRRPRAGSFEGSLDSLVDIVANSLGTLVLVATLTVLGSRGIQVNLGTPIIREVDEGMERVDFECRRNRVIPIDHTAMAAERDAIRDCTGTLDECRGMIEDFNRRAVSTTYHRVEMELGGVFPVEGRTVVVPSIRFKPLDHLVGDLPEDLDDSQGAFRLRLASLDPARQFLTFYVRPDSFEVFRAARKLAKEAGFEVGWHPRDTEALTFGPGGERDTVD